MDLIENKNNNKKPDLIIFARGGGSLEEMMPFNEIDLIKRVFDLKIPSISAIGHETDYTLLDLVCDLRAPTPTAAAELAVPNQVQIATHLNDKKISLIEFLKKKIREPELFIIKFQSSIGILSSRVYETEKKINNNLNTNLKNINNFFISKKDFIYKEIIKINDFNPKRKILMFENKINSIKKNNKMSILNKLKFLSKNISLLQRIMSSSSVDKNLKKGYAIIKKDKNLIKSIKSLKSLNQFSVIMNDGKILIKK